MTCKVHPENKRFVDYESAIAVATSLRDSEKRNFYVLQCDSCLGYHIKRSKPVKHGGHITASVLTGGLWVPFYIWTVIERRKVKVR
jgi:hypothetical protein